MKRIKAMRPGTAAERERDEARAMCVELRETLELLRVVQRLDPNDKADAASRTDKGAKA